MLKRFWRFLRRERYIRKFGTDVLWEADCCSNCDHFNGTCLRLGYATPERFCCVAYVSHLG